jgi:hypothetical protein
LDQIGQLGSFASVGGERQDAIEHVLAGISRLSNEVADASEYVPSYDQRTYSEVWTLDLYFTNARKLISVLLDAAKRLSKL